MPDVHAPRKAVITVRVDRADGTSEERVVGVHHPDKRLHARFQRLLEAGQRFTLEHVLHDNPPRLKPAKKS